MSHRSNLSPNRVGDEWDAYIHSSLSESLAIHLEGSALSFPPKVAALPPAAWSSAEVQIRGNARRIKPSPSRVSRDTTREAPASTEVPRIETPEKLIKKKLTFESRILKFTEIHWLQISRDGDHCDQCESFFRFNSQLLNII